ncbi:MAG: lipoyl synthase [Bacillota bacterium]
MYKPKPDWFKVSYDHEVVEDILKMMDKLSLNTVCTEAHCPNIGECFKKNSATFMIMGKNCTRNCRFCIVSKGALEPLDPEEPKNVARAAKHMNLKHIVITSVTRDDLSDGGAAHFAQTVREVKEALPGSTVEVLIPDFNGAHESLDMVIHERPDVIGHNLETVPSLYSAVRPQANYERSIGVLQYVKETAPDILTKTGIMVGLGETEEEITAVMGDLVRIKCDIMTIGQYLRPSKEHLDVKEYITPETFEHYKAVGEGMGIRFIASGPLVRSSYKASEAIKAIKGEKQA